jgi:hypothetical protein
MFLIMRLPSAAFVTMVMSLPAIGQTYTITTVAGTDYRVTAVTTVQRPVPN